MSTVKINELAKEVISTTEWFVKADDNGIATKNTISSLANTINTLGSTNFRGILMIVDTPTEDGFYFAGESGTFTNADNIVVDLNNGFTIITVASTQTVFDSLVIPLNYTPVQTFDKTDNDNAASMKAIDDYYQPKITKNSDDIGDKTTLTTTDKSSTVAAINEVDAKSKANENTIGTYTDPEGQGDLSSDVVELYNLVSTAQSTANTADGKADTNATNIGNKATLTTTDKTNTVAAINEVNATANTATTLAILSL